MGIFTKKAKIMLYNEAQKDHMIENLEKQHIEYRLKVKKGELMNDQNYYELTLTASDLPKVS